MVGLDQRFVGPPNGSRLSCGRLARRRTGVGRSPCPARAQHSASIKAITARQLQALVRRPVWPLERWRHTARRQNATASTSIT